jgi:hypothetical protein
MAQVNGPSIPTSGLVLSLDAANLSSYPGSGTTWYDLSVNKYNHGLYGSYSFTSFQNVTCFNFTTTGVSLPLSSTYTFNGWYTMLAWANALSDAQASTWRTLWRTTPDDHPLIISDGSDILGYYDNNAGGFVSYGGTLGGLTNKWTMFVLTGNGASTSLYYNNATFVGTVNYSANGNSHNAIGSAGDTSGGSQPFGYVATAMLYSRPLTTSEISQIYITQKSRFGL